MESKILRLCAERKAVWNAMSDPKDHEMAKEFKRLTVELTRLLKKHKKPVYFPDGNGCVRLNADGDGPAFIRESLWRHSGSCKKNGYRAVMASLDLADALRRGRAS